MCRRVGLANCRTLLILGFAVSLGLPAGLQGAEKKDDAKKPAEKKITYDEDIKPILRAKCFACHNPDKKSGDLDQTNFTNLMQGGGSGAVIEPGSADDSYLYMLITHDSEPFMPPGQGKLPDEMIASIKSWIDGGALENIGSKASGPSKPKFDLAMKLAPTGKPEGPPPMPEGLSVTPVVHTHATTAVTALATSPWAPLAAVAGEKQVLLYNSETLKLIGILPFPEGFPKVLKFSRNGSLLLAGGGRGGLLGLTAVWNVKTGERVIQLGDELDSVLAADISADQSLIALGGPKRVVRVYSTKENKLLYELRKHTDWITSIAFSPDGVLLATGDRNGGLYVWEAYTGREYLALPGHKGLVSGVSWRPDSNILASASEDGTVKLWEMNNGSQVKSWNAHGGGTESVEFTRDGRLVSCGRDRVTKLWDQNGKQVRAFEAFGDLALAVTFCDETGRVIAGDWTGEVRVWDSKDGKRLGGLSTNPPKP